MAKKKIEENRKRWVEEDLRKEHGDANLLPEQRFHGWCDHPNTMENSTATVLWIAAMIVSILFKGGWALCILETIAWWKFITRHKK